MPWLGNVIESEVTNAGEFLIIFRSPDGTIQYVQMEILSRHFECKGKLQVVLNITYVPQSSIEVISHEAVHWIMNEFPSLLSQCVLEGLVAYTPHICVVVHLKS